MTIQDFEEELKLIDKDLSIRPNNPPARVLEMYPDVAKIACIIYRGSELCTIPNDNIYDEASGNYGVDLRSDGRFVKHRTRPEALSIVKEKIERLKTDKDYHDAFFGLGEYSDAALKSKDDNQTVELVEEVAIEPKAVQGGTLEA